MTNEIGTNKGFSGWIRICALAALIAAFAVSGKFVGLMQGYGLVFVVLGGAALALMSFSFPEIGASFKCAAGGRGTREDLRISGIFWEASARNFWLLGVFAAVLSFIEALTSMSRGIAAMASGMASSLVPSVYGALLGALCLVPAWKAGKILEAFPVGGPSSSAAGAARKTEPFWKMETAAGYILFLLLSGWTIIRPLISAPSSSSKSWAWFLSGPAALVILGGTTVFVLFAGKAGAGIPLTASFALTALIGSLIGFIQVLLGFASGQFSQPSANIASGFAFILSSCFLGLGGMILAGSPLEDRLVKSGRIEKPSAVSRAAWAVFPLVTLIFLVMTFFLVLTPVRK